MPDPHPTHRFLVEVAGLPTAAFSEVAGLDVAVETVEYREGADRSPSPRRLPGLVRWADLRLSRGLVDLQLYAWVTLAMAHDDDAQRDLTIALLDEDHQPVLRWQVGGARPVALRGPVLRAGESGVAVETLVLAHEGWVLEEP